MSLNFPLLRPESRAWEEEEPAFRLKEVSICSERRLRFSKMNKSFAQYLYMFSSITYIVLVWE